MKRFQIRVLSSVCVVYALFKQEIYICFIKKRRETCVNCCYLTFVINLVRCVRVNTGIWTAPMCVQSDWYLVLWCITFDRCTVSWFQWLWLWYWTICHFVSSSHIPLLMFRVAKWIVLRSLWSQYTSDLRFNNAVCTTIIIQYCVHTSIYGSTIDFSYHNE